MPAKLEWPLQFRRQYAAAIDDGATFETAQQMDDYLTNPLRYKGQVVTCEEEEGKIFIMNNARDAWIEFDPGTADEGTLQEDVTSMFDVGNIVAGFTLNANKTFTEFVKRLLLTVFEPTFIAPAATLAANFAANVEAGHQDDLVLTASFNRGQIRGDWDGYVWDFDMVQDYRAGEATKYTIAGTDMALVNVRTLSAEQITDGANTYTLQVDYDEGPQPVDSAGEDFGTTIGPDNVSASRTINGRRKLFYGADDSNNTAYTTSGEIRGMSDDHLNPADGYTFDIDIADGDQMVSFAYPATLRDVDSVKFVEGMNAEIKASFTKTTVDVEGANGYTAISYKLYTYVPAAPYSQAATYRVTI